MLMAKDILIVEFVIKIIEISLFYNEMFSYSIKERILFTQS